MTKGKLAQPGLIFMNQMDPERYTKDVGGQDVAHESDLYHYGCNIKQLLALEHQSASQNFIAGLVIPPSILLHMLEFLCCRHVDPMRAQAALDDLQDLVHHDQGELVHPLLRNISLEILGICQKVTENHQAALYSYYQSLAFSQYPINGITICHQTKNPGLTLDSTINI